MVKKTLIFALNVFGHEIGSYLLKLEVEEQKETKKKLWLGALEEMTQHINVSLKPLKISAG